MITDPAIPPLAAAPHPFTLNDLRVRNSIVEAPSSTSALTRSGLVLTAALAIGAFLWLDPLRLFTPTEAGPPAPAFGPSAEPARPTERQEIIAPLTPVPSTNPVTAPTAPALVVGAPRVAAPVIRPRAASIRPESRGSPMEKTNTTVVRASPRDETAPPALLTNQEERTNAPIVPMVGDDTRNVPKPAASNGRTPVTQ